MVVGRRHFDAVHADEGQGGQFFQQRQHLVAAQAAGLGRAGAGREGRVQAVDVQAQVQRRLAMRGQPAAHRLQHRRQLGWRLQAAQVAGGEDLAALVAHIVAGRTNAR